MQLLALDKTCTYLARKETTVFVPIITFASLKTIKKRTGILLLTGAFDWNVLTQNLL